MKRALMIALILPLMIALPLVAVIAQPPPGTPPPIPTAGGPTATPFAPPPPDSNLPPGLSGVQQPTATPTLIELVPEVTAEAVPENELGVDAVDPSDPTPLLIRARADINTLADDVLGTNQRPEGWSGLTTTDIDNPDFLLLTRLDLEILAGLIAGSEVRPAGWFGASASSDYAIARDIRHDLELLADIRFDNTRPTGWNGDDPLLRCNRATQTLVRLLEINGLFTVEVDPLAADFCQQVEINASRFAEVNLLANPMMNGSLTGSGDISGEYAVNSDFAVGFLDRGAAQRLGVIPSGTVINPIARSPAQFSNMMLVRGDGFEVFVDYQFTDVPEDVFDDLPDVDSVEAVPFCDAEWCAG